MRPTEQLANFLTPSLTTVSAAKFLSRHTIANCCHILHVYSIFIVHNICRIQGFLHNKVLYTPHIFTIYPTYILHLFCTRIHVFYIHIIHVCIYFVYLVHSISLECRCPHVTGVYRILTFQRRSENHHLCRIQPPIPLASLPPHHYSSLDSSVMTAGI